MANNTCIQGTIQLCDYYNQNSQIDFKMNNLNPRICEWLHYAWKQVQNMEETIVKGWDMTILPRHSKVNFSLLQWRQIQPLPY
jgi:hypothetical protein